jgi:DNA repair exonuclease SbcCD ATPase subunit
MPTTTSSTATGAKPRKTAAKRATARKPASSKRASATQAKATQAKAARTRTLHQSQSTLGQAQTATRETAEVIGEYAERAVLIPVGAWLIARDRVVESVTDTLSTYGSSTKTQAQLRRFERRGATARSRLEREVRKARVRVERELRQRRRGIESTVGELEDRRDALTKSGSDLAGRVPDLAGLVPDLAGRSPIGRVPELANRVQERILSLV